MTLAVDDALGEPSVHYVSIADYTGGPGGASRIEVVGDVSGQLGRQVVDWHAAGGQGVATIELLMGKAYFRASTASMLADYFFFPASSASELAGRWIEIGPSESFFKSGLTVSSTIESISNRGPYSAVVRARRGPAAVDELHGFVLLVPGSRPAAGTFVISTSQHPLPVAVTAKGAARGQNVSLASTFGSWGEFVEVTPPPAAVPYSIAVQGNVAA